jgi:rubrerythrin
MTTTVGTERHLIELVRDLVQLDLAAIEAYKSAISKLQNPEYKIKLIDFCEDHVQHTRVLGTWMRDQREVPPEGGGMKQVLTTGKVALAAIVGDKMILQAMKTNEDDTTLAYERALKHQDADDLHTVFENNLSDERRHRSWLVATLATL